MSLPFFSYFRKNTETIPAGVQRLSADAFLKRRDQRSVVIDVRTLPEYAAGHVQDAHHIDLMAPDFQEKIASLDPDRDYYLYCRSGSRSGRAAEMMRALGFERVYNIGGIGELERGGVETSRL